MIPSKLTFRGFKSLHINLADKTFIAEEELEKPLAFEKPDVPYMETEHAKEYLGHGEWYYQPGTNRS
jgi:hypothetical protein